MKFIKLHELIFCDNKTLTLSGPIDVNCIQICSIKPRKAFISEYAKKEILKQSPLLLKSDLDCSTISLANGKKIIVAESKNYILRTISEK